MINYSLVDQQMVKAFSPISGPYEITYDGNPVEEVLESSWSDSARILVVNGINARLDKVVQIALPEERVGLVELMMAGANRETLFTIAEGACVPRVAEIAVRKLRESYPDFLERNRGSIHTVSPEHLG